MTAAALLKAGADPAAADTMGQTPRGLAAAAGHDRLLELLPAPHEGLPQGIDQGIDQGAEPASAGGERAGAGGALAALAEPADQGVNQGVRQGVRQGAQPAGAHGVGGGGGGAGFMALAGPSTVAVGAPSGSAGVMQAREGIRNRVKHPGDGEHTPALLPASSSKPAAAGLPATSGDSAELGQAPMRSASAAGVSPESSSLGSNPAATAPASAARGEPLERAAGALLEPYQAPEERGAPDLARLGDAGPGRVLSAAGDEPDQAPAEGSEEALVDALAAECSARQAAAAALAAEREGRAADAQVCRVGHVQTVNERACSATPGCSPEYGDEMQGPQWSCKALGARPHAQVHIAGYVTGGEGML